jgi:mRNA interferase RelE/StbE
MLSGIVRRVIYGKDALKVLERIPANTARLIRAKIAQYAADPRSLANNVKTLKGEDGFLRMRVGDWRVVLNASELTVEVVDVGPRGSIYG